VTVASALSLFGLIGLLVVYAGRALAGVTSWWLSVPKPPPADPHPSSTNPRAQPSASSEAVSQASSTSSFSACSALSCASSSAAFA
jgi:hypothetical protein